MPKSKLTLKQLSIRDKTVLMRVDFNVPQDAQQKITDDTRIVATIPSIQYVIDHGGSVVLMSHLGRPDGKWDSKASLKPCAKRLSELLARPVQMAPDCIGPETKKMASALKPGEVLLLENLRFHSAEEHPEQDPQFAKQLSALGDLYVNDAFGTAHRSHSSTATITQYFPKKAAAGFLMQKELRYLGDALMNPQRPFYAIIGGSKISSKLGIIKSLLKKVDGLLIGGGMTYTFLKAQGIEIGNSIHQDDFIDTAKEILAECEEKGIKFLLPTDIKVTDKIDGTGELRIVKAKEGIPAGFEGVDIGPQTIQEYTSALEGAAVIFWNGPVGVFEIPAFSKGTLAIAKKLAISPATTIVGGGDSISALHMAGVAAKINHISTGGGASLEYIEYGTLPGIEALS